MDDTVSRRAAIDAIDSCRRLILPNGILDTDAVSAIKALPSAQPEQQWIPVSERLPEVDEDVLVTDFGGGMATVHDDSCGEYEDGSGRFWYTSQNVVAWMPMPKPYKKSKNITIKKLKPCPFCGGTVKLQRDEHVEGDTTYTITCFNCYVDMGEYKTVEEIREVWNRRVES